MEVYNIVQLRTTINLPDDQNPEDAMGNNKLI
jgi:hypothetical protein